jgi:hypothetical protein
MPKNHYIVGKTAFVLFWLGVLLPSRIWDLFWNALKDRSEMEGKQRVFTNVVVYLADAVRIKRQYTKLLPEGGRSARPKQNSLCGQLG